jgi:hypothetical protein
MESPESTRALETELAALRAANAALTDRLARLESALGEDTPATPPTGETRRGMLKLLAGAGAGAVAATVIAGQPAAAATGDPLVLGQVNETGDRPTRADYTGSEGDGIAFLFQAGAGEGLKSGTGTTYDAALAGFVGAGSNVTTGVYGYSDRPGANGVVGFADSSDGIGVRARGGRAGLLIMGGGFAAPPAGSATHQAGEIQADQNGDLWACVADGTPGQWRKLAGISTGGAFHPINPIRVYDSRQTAYTPNGRLARNTNIVVSVKDARTSAGAVATADAVPPGAIAIAYNLTVTQPQGGNFLSIAPGDATGYTASAINFNGSADIANGGIVKLDGSRQVKIFCGDQLGSTHVILDVTGYYR